MVEIAVEQDGRGLGRCRIQVIEDATTATIRAFLIAHVEPGTVVISDGLSSYVRACRDNYAMTISTGPNRSAPRACRPTSYSRACTGSRRWPSAGCEVRTREASSQHTSRPISTFTFRFNRRSLRTRRCRSTAYSSRRSRPSHERNARSPTSPGPAATT